MLSDRFMISDEQWALMEPHCLGKKSDPGPRFFYDAGVNSEQSEKAIGSDLYVFRRVGVPETKPN